MTFTNDNDTSMDGMEDVTMDDLLKFDDDDNDEEDDADLLELQQKLTGGGGGEESKQPSREIVTATTPAAAAAIPDAQSNISGRDTPVDLSLEDQVSKLQQENAQLQLRIQELHLANDRVDPNAPSTDDLLVQISELETQVTTLQQEKAQLQQQLQQPPPVALSSNSNSPAVAELLQKIHALETMNQRLQDGNSQLQSQVQELRQEQDKQHERQEGEERPQQQRQSKSSSTDDDEDDENTSTPQQSSAWQYAGQMVKIQELETLVDNLQQRIVGLVEEKLVLQTNFDRMKHEYKQMELIAQGSVGGGLFSTSKRGSWFPTGGRGGPSSDDGTNGLSFQGGTDTNNDETLSQTDLLKQAMASKKMRESSTGGGGLLGGILGVSMSTSSSSSPAHNQERQSLTKNSSHDQDNNGNLDDTIDVELYKKLAEHEARYGKAATTISKQKSHEEFDKEVQAFAEKNNKRGVGFGSFFSKSSNVQEEDGQFNSSPTRHSKILIPLTMESLPSMLGSKLNSREDLSLEEDTIDFHHHHSSDGDKKKKEELFPPLAEVEKVIKTHKAATVSKTQKKTPIGQGKMIDQSNLLGHYVAKKQGSTLNYLTGLLYGSDDVGDTNEDADDFLRQELNKKRQEDLRKAQEEKEARERQVYSEDDEPSEAVTPQKSSTPATALSSTQPPTFEELTGNTKPKTSLSGAL